MQVTALIMSGGRGSRLGNVDKGSLNICGKPMIKWVLDNLINAGIEKIIVAVSIRNYDTLRILKEVHSDVYISSGVDYVTDLSFALKLIRLRPLLVMPVDTPLITPDIILDFINKGIELSKPVVNMTGRRGYVGVTLFNESMGEWVDVNYDSPLVMDIDTPHDVNTANQLCLRLRDK
ncbi:NTP transferase domain-containing protein [Caldivirga sp. UBA161]|uniref:NTP transferase domain-containing protein n=1 Tax=Caldivirga sp. UBA161 TaxID=1915569 RepID=UPI0025C480DB|nr:NTP transferase domain-containing protein [Caldivirga sp. UBA161]